MVLNSRGNLTGNRSDREEQVFARKEGDKIERHAMEMENMLQTYAKSSL